MKQVRYTQGRMAERSKAPDSRNSPLRLLVHVCVRGFESHSCQFLRSKRQHFNRSSIESHSLKFCVQKANILVEAVFLRVKSRARRSRFHITRRCYRRQDEASAIYSRQEGRAVWGARHKKFSFETSGTRMCASVRILLLSNLAFKKATF